MSKKSIPAWLKKNNGWGGPYEKIVEAITYHAGHGDHPNIAFEGSTLELATALYTEHAKKAGVSGGLYCTWRNVAEKMAKSLNLQPGDTVLIPGLGLGALYQAVHTVQPEASALGVECQEWLVQIARAVEMPVVHGDFLDGVMIPYHFNKVLCNPPMGKLWGSNAVERLFLDKIAERTIAGEKVAILLPGNPGHFWKQLTKNYEYLHSAFHIVEEEEIQNAAAPKSILTTRYLLERV